MVAAQEVNQDTKTPSGYVCVLGAPYKFRRIEMKSGIFSKSKIALARYFFYYR